MNLDPEVPRLQQLADHIVLGLLRRHACIHHRPGRTSRGRPATRHNMAAVTGKINPESQELWHGRLRNGSGRRRVPSSDAYHEVEKLLLELQIPPPDPRRDPSSIGRLRGGDGREHWGKKGRLERGYPTAAVRRRPHPAAAGRTGRRTGASGVAALGACGVA
jgi:hypothetical protein